MDEEQIFAARDLIKKVLSDPNLTVSNLEERVYSAAGLPPERLDGRNPKARLALKILHFIASHTFERTPNAIENSYGGGPTFIANNIREISQILPGIQLDFDSGTPLNYPNTTEEFPEWFKWMAEKKPKRATAARALTQRLLHDTTLTIENVEERICLESGLSRESVLHNRNPAADIARKVLEYLYYNKFGQSLLATHRLCGYRSHDAPTHVAKNVRYITELLSDSDSLTICHGHKNFSERYGMLVRSNPLGRATATRELSERVLGDQCISLDNVEEKICSESGVSQTDLIKSRKPAAFVARNVLYFLLRRKFNKTYNAIKKRVGLVNHSGIMRSIRYVEGLQRDPLDPEQLSHPDRT